MTPSNPTLAALENEAVAKHPRPSDRPPATTLSADGKHTEKPIGHHKAPNRIPMIGRKFGRLTVISYHSDSRNRNICYLCKCECGNEKAISGNSLRRGLTRSCGCLVKNRDRSGSKNPAYSHGHSDSPTWKSWTGMIQRCANPNNPKYKNYGARGICICKRWMKFENFLEDMGARPPGTSIGRIDNDGDYDPSNCRWETSKQQANNKRGNHLIAFNGQILTMSQTAARTGIHYSALRQRFHRGWTMEKAITTPMKGKQ